jgi:hypothetical protein
MWNWNQHTV